MNLGRFPVWMAALAALSVASVAPASGAETLAGPVPASVLKVTDGDTLLVRARIWLGQDMTVSVRLAGVDAPELRGRCPVERALAAAARDALARAAAGRPIRLVDIRYDKYGGRVIARVLDSSGGDVGQALLKAGHVRRYDGRARAGWCEAGAGGR